MPDVISRRRNGGYFVKLWDNGTKERFQVSDDPPVYPETVDLKITNYCNLADVCTYCHEGSDKSGGSADIHKVKEIISSFPRGTEFALGGGNPLAYNYLSDLLRWMENEGYVASMTVNQLHMHDDSDREYIAGVKEGGYLKGVGVSFRSIGSSWSMIFNELGEIVVHVIAGVESPPVIQALKDYASVVDVEPKFLILGYKTAGRGEDYILKNSGDVRGKILDWRDWLGNNIGEYNMSFDNLAINQLNVKDHVPDEKWDERYLGEEGQFSMYIDAVEEEYSVSSFYDEAFTLRDPINIEAAFDHVREIS